MTDEDFVKMMVNAKGTERELADLLLVSRPTIDRWKRGVTAPHPLLRDAIKKILNKII